MMIDTTLMRLADVALKLLHDVAVELDGLDDGVAEDEVLADPLRCIVVVDVDLDPLVAQLDDILILLSELVALADAVECLHLLELVGRRSLCHKVRVLLECLLQHALVTYTTKHFTFSSLLQKDLYL